MSPSSPIVRFIFQSILIGGGIFIAAHTSSGISYGGDWGVLCTAILLWTGLNLVLKPILVMLTLPFVILTLGLGLLVINALIFLLLDKLIPGFYVESFWDALWGAFMVSLLSLMGGKNKASKKPNFTRAKQHPGVKSVPQKSFTAKKNDPDVIDI